LRNNDGRFISAFFGFIPSLSDILLVEHTVIYHGLVVSKDLRVDKLVCYSDSLVCINLLNGHVEKFDIYAILIQNIQDMSILDNNITVCHTLRKSMHSFFFCEIW